MTPISQVQQNHKSIRSFTNKAIPEDILQDIVNSAHRAPTSSNLQALSIIKIQSSRTKEKLAELTGGQPWLANCHTFFAIAIDYHKTHIATMHANGEQLIHNTTEGIISGSLDSGIALANMMTCAQAHGLSVVPIGGVRNNITAISKLLHLPEKCAVLVGLCLGYSQKEGTLKPRLPQSVFLHNETYDQTQLQNAIKDYDTTLENFWKNSNRKNGLKWSESLKENQTKFAKRHILEDLKSVGFFVNSVS